MKRNISTILIAIVAMMAVHAQEKVIKPQSIIPMPKITVEKWEKLFNQYGDDSFFIYSCLVHGSGHVAELCQDGDDA